ncbi:MAG TPA: hypothetical protein VFJ90_02990 [Candidatus Didemnitutus sp.]|nr:hypothetical protein [Candidatus Didemnitutus sp.]
MKPFLLGKKSVEEHALRAPNATHRPPPPPGGVVRPAPSGPNVEVVKEGDKVVRIIVTCACGERTEVECLYPVGS